MHRDFQDFSSLSTFFFFFVSSAVTPVLRRRLRLLVTVTVFHPRFSITPEEAE